MPDASDHDELGPIDFVAVEFPDGKVAGDGFEQLLRLADRGTIAILDVELVAKEADGEVHLVGPDRLEGVAGSDLAAGDGAVWDGAVWDGAVWDGAVWEGAASGLLDDEDIAAIGAALAPGSVAAVVVYENRWVLGVVESWRAGGARLIADGGVLLDDLLFALDAGDGSGGG